MSGPSLNLSGNLFQDFNPGKQYDHLQSLNDEQLEHLNAIASMAKGSGILGTGFLEGKNGGEGFIGSFIDSVTGQKHYVKMLTQSKERAAARGKDANEAKLLSDSEVLGKMSSSMKDDLLELARVVGVEKKVQDLLDSRSGEFKDLVGRKIAAQAVTIISEAHNKIAKLARARDAQGVNDAVRGSRDLFNWDAVARARTEGDTSLKAVLTDSRIVKSGQSVTGRQFTTSGVNVQVRLAEIEQGTSGDEGRKYYVDCIRNGLVPKSLAKPLNPKFENVSNSAVDPGTKKEIRAFYDKMVRDLLCELLGDSRQSLRRDDILELAGLVGNVAEDVVSKGVLKNGTLSNSDKDAITKNFKSAFLSARLEDVSGQLNAVQSSLAKKGDALNAAQEKYNKCCQGIKNVLQKAGASKADAPIAGSLDDGSQKAGSGEGRKFKFDDVVALWNKLSNAGNTYVKPEGTGWKNMRRELNVKIPLPRVDDPKVSLQDRSISLRIKEFNKAFDALEHEKRVLPDNQKILETKQKKLSDEKDMLVAFRDRNGIELPEKRSVVNRFEKVE